MKNPRLQRNSTDGFTLIEMIVVVLMIGVLFAIGSPSWVSFLNNQRVGAARDEILQTIRQAQAEAVRTRREKTVVLDTAANPPRITGFQGPPSVQIGAGKFTAGMIGVQVAPASGATITFTSTGALRVANPGDIPTTITVSAPANGGAKRCVVIQTLLGNMRSLTKGEAGCL